MRRVKLNSEPNSNTRIRRKKSDQLINTAKRSKEILTINHNGIVTDNDYKCSIILLVNPLVEFTFQNESIIETRLHYTNRKKKEEIKKLMENKLSFFIIVVKMFNEEVYPLIDTVVPLNGKFIYQEKIIMNKVDYIEWLTKRNNCISDMIDYLNKNKIEKV